MVFSDLDQQSHRSKMLIVDKTRRYIVKGVLFIDHRVQKNSRSPNILRSSFILLATQDFRRSVIQGPMKRIKRPILDVRRTPKVNHFNTSASIQHNILIFNISMNDATDRMQMFYSRTSLMENALC